ncbi:MAG: tRNA (cytidine(34)-2'-O)-methyltransferase [Alphaproteobacteria bacterium]|nr:tRNA (cytidine(34)-2'-O)-methyltransferase [Alphaproteobacteria bacterium]
MLRTPGISENAEESRAPRLALFQPDIPQNAGAVLRLAACLGVGVEIVEPMGFLWDDRKLRRAGMDYAPRARVTRHVSWPAFEAWRRGEGRRLVLFTTKGAIPLPEAKFLPGDILLFGAESSGVPDEVHAQAGLRLAIPLVQGERSLNVAQAAAIGIYTALAGLGKLPV